MRNLVILILLSFGCKTKPPVSAIDFTPDFTKPPATVVYTTKKKYKELVPVQLSEDKSRIVSYPGITDIQTSNGFPLPTVLHDGYYLDNRGVNKQIAFLKLTYAEYAKLDSLPPVAEMYTWIIDRDPLTSIYDCGCRKMFTNAEQQLNAIIDAKQLGQICHLIK